MIILLRDINKCLLRLWEKNITSLRKNWTNLDSNPANRHVCKNLKTHQWNDLKFEKSNIISMSVGLQTDLEIVRINSENLIIDLFDDTRI